ncbi:enoyl-CoA hydratase/isomerase family protein [Bowmanella sp. JS7-9]|uniref:3-hydroxyisobutyryl-CoA hydrolase n=1 Tax=Pseudobowmanella zhangzhouensis TaxID=1537679 RepID=A0ABW1XMF9_9ALTE|nr:enoyl-CoA hydratase/isomerase family protein [Bowmanella sp. JS7-9]
MDKVIFNEISLANGKRLGHARLNKPQALNALDLDMIQLLMPQLTTWQADGDVVAVVLDGEGDKAFCAGGDVVDMYHAMVASPDSTPAKVEQFFTEEYQLDYLIHTFGKPFVVVGNGIVMGGGLGLFAGASHRIVTPTSRIAMPEITIGLYPDVGGSYFLNQMPTGVGLFLGLTGASINARDALDINLADAAMNDVTHLIDALRCLDWQGESAADNTMIGTWLAQQTEQATLPAGQVREVMQECVSFAAMRTSEQIVAAILGMDNTGNEWLQRAQKTLQQGCPLTMAIVPEQLSRAQDMSLADVFRMELTLSCRCAQMGEFQEGVRALLIDKDRSPKWRYQNAAEITPQVVAHMFTPLWQGAAHPLARL